MWAPPGHLHTPPGHLHTHKPGGSLNSFDRFGHEKWSQQLPQSRPEDPQINLSNREERSKRPYQQESGKTLKTTTLSSEKLSFGGREGIKFIQLWSRSRLEGGKSSIPRRKRGRCMRFAERRPRGRPTGHLHRPRRGGVHTRPRT